MESILEDILKDDFVEYTRVYQMAALNGISKKEAKELKKRMGVKTIEISDGDDRLWLWYIPRKVLKKHSPKK